MQGLSFLQMLDCLLDLAKKQKKIQIKEIFSILQGKGYAALLILFSLPCSFPVQIPGFSTPFGIILCFLGLRLIFSHHIWWPEWILKKELNSDHVIIAVEKVKKIFLIVQKGTTPRLKSLSQNTVLRRVNGLLVAMLAAFLALPLPIPLSNMLAALPILFLGLGLLEEDGVIILFSYFLFLVGCLGVIFLFVFGAEELAHLLHK